MSTPGGGLIYKLLLGAKSATKTAKKFLMARRNTTASKKAAELSAGFAAREEELQNLAVEFFDLEEKK